MNRPAKAMKIIWFEIGSFGAIIAISWVNEFGLENLLFGQSYARDWKDPIMQTVITVLVAVPTLILSWRQAMRLHYLEKFLKVCSWCRKVGQDDHWITLEEYMETRLNTHTTHGICPSCSRRLKTERSKQEPFGREW